MHVLLWLEAAGWRIYLLCELMTVTSFKIRKHYILLNLTVVAQSVEDCSEKSSILYRVYIYIYICKNENNAPSGYHRNGFVAIHALGHMMYGYIMCTWYIMVTSTVYHVPKCMRCHKAIVVITTSCLCEIWALCVSWMTSDHLLSVIFLLSL